MRILLITLLIILSSCQPTVKIDFSKSVIACTNIHDTKDDIVYYEENKSSFESMTTGVMQYTYVDVYQNRRMLNEFELDNYKCEVVSTVEQYNQIVND
jgi:hypothetical protein